MTLTSGFCQPELVNGFNFGTIKTGKNEFGTRATGIQHKFILQDLATFYLERKK